MEDSDPYAKLAKLGELRTKGVLTEEEFGAQKSRILDTDFGAAFRLTYKTDVAPITQNTDHKTPIGAHLHQGLGPINPAAAAFLPSRIVARIESAGPHWTLTSLVALNSLIFALMMLQNPEIGEWDRSYLLSWGADYGERTLNGEFWRLLTSTFVHVSPIHILSNMACLFVWGAVTEKALGGHKFLLVYLACGVAGSLTSVLAHPEIVSAGASGAIAGLLGVMAVMMMRGDRRVTAGYLGSNLALNVVLAFLFPVDWIAHVGGFVMGLVLGAVFCDQSFKKIECE